MLLRVSRKRKLFGQLLYQCYHAESGDFESKIRIPRKKVWSDTAVLQTLCDSIAADPLKNPYYPLYSVDMHPNSPHQENVMRQCNTRGRETAEFVINNNPRLSNLEWKTDQHHELEVKPTELNVSKNDTNLSVLEDLMYEKSYEKLCEAYLKIITEGTEITQEQNEKVIAFLAFHLQKNNVENLWEVVQSTKSKFTKHNYMSIVRGFAQKDSFWKAISVFDDMISEGCLPDSKTTDMLLSCLILPRDNVKLLNRFVTAWKQHGHGVKPTSLTIGVLGFGFHKSGMKKTNAISLWGKCLNEMKHCNIVLDLSTLSCMLSYASRVLQEEIVILSILEILDHTAMPNHSHMHTSEGFHDAMVLAYKNSNLRLANRLYQSVQKLERKGIAVRDPRRVFYSRYLILLCQEDTMENFIRTASDLMFKKVFYSPSVSDGLMKACVMRKWPQVLPFLFQYLDRMLHRKLEQFSSWLAAARILIDTADADTLLQMKHIAQSLYGLMRMNPTSSEADFFLSSICILIAKSGDKDALVDILTNARKFHSHVSLEKDAVEICVNAFGSKLSALEPFMR